MHGRYAKHRKQIPGDGLPSEFFGLTSACEGCACVADGGHLIEDGILRLPVEKIPGGDYVALVTLVLIPLPDHHQTVRLMVGERPDQNGIYDAEDGAIRAYAESQGDRGDNREAG